MNYRILVIKNRLSIPVADVIEQTRAYFLLRTPLEIVVETVVSDFDVTVGNWGITTKEGVPLNGVIALRLLLKKLGINGLNYNAIIFAYDPTLTLWWKNPVGELRHWTHWDSYDGAALIEIATTSIYGTWDFYRVATHELIHAFHLACRMNLIPTVDTLDLYDKEMEPEAPDGNRARNIKELAEEWGWVPHQPFLALLIKKLTLQVNLLVLKAQLSNMNLIEKWALAIKKHEGWYFGSRSYRNNNPANAKFVGQRLAIGADKDGFAIFRTYEDGFTYLKTILRNAATGKSQVYSPAMSLYEFFAKYAPSSDGNTPKSYAENVAKEIGVEPTSKISSLV